MPDTTDHEIAGDPAKSGVAAMLTTSSPQQDVRPVDGPPTDAACGVCSHAHAHHDAIGLRFCRATAAAALTRGCICRPERR